MTRTYAYIVILTNDDGVTQFKVAIAATDVDGLKKQIAELYPGYEWYSHVDEKYPLV